MASGLSEDDFHCLQNQLLELKNKVYLLEEKNRKYCLEINRLNCNCDFFKDEYAKAQKVIQRSKNAHELQNVSKENERLLQKLQSQEDEFRLQNETLMQEVQALAAAKDVLEKDLELNRTETNSMLDKENCEDLLKLEAENLALKKLLQNQEKNSSSPITQNAIEIAVEEEEKFLLKEKFTKLQKRHKEDIFNLQNENEKLTEKLKKKQESIMQLHTEKEKMYSDHEKSYTALLAEKENCLKTSSEEMKNLKEQAQTLKFQLKNALQCKEYNDKIVNSFHDQEATVQLMSGEKASFEYSSNEVKASCSCDHEIIIRNLSAKMEELKVSVVKLQEENVFLSKEKATLEGERSDLENEKTDLMSALSEQSNLAEQRKAHMEEMNNHILETTNKHSKEIENLTQQLMQEQDALQKLFDKERETRLELVQSQNEVQNLRKELEQVTTEFNETQNELTQASEIKAEIELTFQQQLTDKEDQRKVDIQAIEDKFQFELKDMNIQLELSEAVKTEFEEKVEKLQQESKDFSDERRILEKKSASLAKDLKRQLLTERKRADKLQERLQEVLNEQNRSVDEIWQAPSGDKAKCDTSSISSWSYVSAEAAEREGRENPSHSDGSSCGRESPSLTSSLENETSSLLAKVTHLQQKNWILDEKVNHLEMSNEALVDDLLKKTAIIQFYCMEGRSNAHASGAQDKLTIKRIVDFIKDKGDENLKEMNRKMQRMLEETLTKNMHLQKDIETLSNEITRLSKNNDSCPENGVIAENRD